MQPSECVLCKSVKSSSIQAGVRYDPDAQVRRCAGCGLVFLHQPQSEEDLNEYYEGAYRAEYSDALLAERYRADLGEARTRVRRLLPWLNSNATLLEVGCGSGAFLDAVRPYVKKAVGVEPDSDSRDWIQGHLNLPVAGSLADIPEQGPTFSLVCAFHVVEHTTNPVEFLLALRRRLDPQGQMVIEVPNIDDVLVSVYQIPDYLRFYYQKAHLYYFSRDTLTAALRQAGLTGQVEGIQRYDLSNHLRWMLTGQPGGQGRYNDVLTPAACAAYADALVQANRSDTLWAVVQSSHTADQR